MKLKDKTEVMIHGHRGSRGTHPENTLASFSEANDAGADFVELDVHLTLDSQLVVFHDFEIAATSLGELTLEQIKAKNSAIPSLNEVIEWKLAKAPRLGLNVEIKRDDRKGKKTPAAHVLAESVVTLLDETKLLESSLIQSFDFEVVRALRKLSAQVKLSSLFEKKADFAQQALNNRSQVAAPQFNLLGQENIQRARSLGIEILPWTVNKPEDWTRLIGMGVRGIITDFPRLLVAHLLSK
jgi:glycerophosphoryl diester phosphodiesterase